MSEEMISPLKGQPLSSNLLEFNEIEEDKHSQALQQQFYHKFLEDNRLMSCKIVGTTKIQGTVFKRSYAIYQIEVITEDIHYNINKRYSQFRELWQASKNNSYDDEENFPPKTYLRSSVEENIVSERKENLNKFLSNFVEKNHFEPEVRVLFYKFLQIWENYCQKGFNEQVMSQRPNSIEQIITLQIMKLNGISKNVNKIFKAFTDVILQKKTRLSTQNIRKILFGIGDKKGVVQFVLSNNNQIIIIQGLKFLLTIMDPQQNRQAEAYCKIFSTCSSQSLILNPQKQIEFFSNSVIKNHYFQILQIYLEKKQKLNWKLLFGAEHEGMLKSYLFWQRSQKLFNDTITQAQRSNSEKKIQFNKCSAFSTATSSNGLTNGLKKSILSQSSSTKQRKQSTINFIDTLLKQLESYDQMQLFNYETIYREELRFGQLIQTRISDNNQVIKINIKSALSLQSLKQAIMSGGKQWNLNFSKTQQLNQTTQTYIRTISFRKNKPKRYKFQLQVSQQNNVYQIVKYPIHSVSGDFCLLETITLRENKGTQIELNFGMCHKNVSDYFSEQFSGQESTLAKLIKQTLIK